MYLFEALEVCPNDQGFPSNFREFSYQDVADAVASIKTYIAGRDNIKLVEEPAKLVVYHLLAMSGLLHLRFGTRKDRTQEDPEAARIGYCEKGRLAPNDGYEFRPSDELARLPETAEIINELWGVPLPIRGAETIFFGGLKFASEGGTVLSISGKPGTGKTSVALALAAALAPMGAKTYYVTAEESPDNLKARLSTLIPEFIRDLSAFRGQTDDWFRARPLSPIDVDNDTSPSEILKALFKNILTLTHSGTGATSDGLPIPCPLIVVLDGVHHFLWGRSVQSSRDDQEYMLERMIADCRKLRALVILTMAEERGSFPAFDYLVDTVINLEYLHTEKSDDKPVRMLLLRKTRHQLSRPGAHICHISGPEGFRISPQLPSQLDRRTVLRFGLPSETELIDLLNRPVRTDDLGKIDPAGEVLPFRPDPRAPHFLDVFARSHILVHGRESSGKAGFGLKILLSPVLTRDGKSEAHHRNYTRVLVASFLYPEEYYSTLKDRLRKLLRFEYSNLSGVKNRPTNIEVLHFYPGYLNPEDFYAKIDLKLDQADLEGEPFTGVLLDGLHNVFLQFPRLSENSMVWPMLYGMLRTRDVTVVTTHTTFNVSNTSVEDMELIIKQAKPLMHALVQATDFHFDVSRATSADDEKDFEIIVRSAVSQPKPFTHLFWSREKLVLHSGARQEELFGKKRAPILPAAGMGGNSV
jgi:KaiC/GvpD/RAD55 family RecA-like ATPase